MGFYCERGLWDSRPLYMTDMHIHASTLNIEQTRLLEGQILTSKGVSVILTVFREWRTLTQLGSVH
jgi:hypothetical protein